MTRSALRWVLVLYVYIYAIGNLPTIFVQLVEMALSEAEWHNRKVGNRKSALFTYVVYNCVLASRLTMTIICCSVCPSLCFYFVKFLFNLTIFAVLRERSSSWLAFYNIVIDVIILRCGGCIFSSVIRRQVAREALPKRTRKSTNCGTVVADVNDKFSNRQRRHESTDHLDAFLRKTRNVVAFVGCR